MVLYYVGVIVCLKNKHYTQVVEVIDIPKRIYILKRLYILKRIYIPKRITCTKN